MDILILGVGGVQVDMLKLLSQNHTIHGLSYKAEGKGRKYTDHFAIIDIKDKKSVLDYARKHNISLVYSIGSDLGMITSAWVSEQLNLPSFISYSTARVCHKKSMLRNKLKHIKGNIEHKVLATPSDMMGLQFPCIIKPVDSQGQRGVFLVRDQEELEQKFCSSVKYSREGKVIAERYIEGPEVSVNTYMIDGEIRFNLISDRIVWPQYSTGIIHKHRIPSQFINPAIESRIIRLISDIVKEVGIKNGPLYSQIKLEGNQPRLIEIAPRLDGCHLWRLIKYATGVDLLKITMNHLMGKNINSIKAAHIDKSWVLEFLCEEPGNHFKTDKYDLDDVCYHEWYYDNGAVVKSINTLLEKCGYKIYQTSDVEVNRNDLEQALSKPVHKVSS